MIDPDRLKRNHVFTVRGKDDKFTVIVKTPEGHEIGVKWERWITMTDKQKADL